jgi:hypothetical protein
VSYRPQASGDPASIAQQKSAIAAGLEAAGLNAQVNQTSGVLDITATVDRLAASPSK